jgi:hypothetical protein
MEMYRSTYAGTTHHLNPWLMRWTGFPAAQSPGLGTARRGILPCPCRYS